MTNKSDEIEFLHRVRAQLDAGTDNMDAQTRSRLSQVRYRALHREESFSGWRTTLVPAGVFAAALTTMVIFGSAGPQPEVVPGFDDLELLSAADFDLLDELEFYEWLDALAVEQSDTAKANQRVPLGHRVEAVAGRAG